MKTNNSLLLKYASVVSKFFITLAILTLLVSSLTKASTQLSVDLSDLSHQSTLFSPSGNKIKPSEGAFVLNEPLSGVYTLLIGSEKEPISYVTFDFSAEKLFTSINWRLHANDKELPLHSDFFSTKENVLKLIPAQVSIKSESNSSSLSLKEKNASKLFPGMHRLILSDNEFEAEVKVIFKMDKTFDEDQIVFTSPASQRGVSPDFDAIKVTGNNIIVSGEAFKANSVPTNTNSVTYFKPCYIDDPCGVYVSKGQTLNFIHNNSYAETDLYYEIKNWRGEVMNNFTQTITAKHGEHAYQLNIPAGLAPGIYVAEFTDSKGLVTYFKFMRQ